MAARYILGLNTYHGDASAVLLRDGQLVAALEEERFRRVKHFAGFPREAIRKCLEMAGIRGSDVEAVAVSRNPRANLMRKAAFTILRRPHPRLIANRLKNARTITRLGVPLADALAVSEASLPPIHKVEHHPAHLASAYYVSPFREAAVCSIDGFGDFVSTSVAHGDGDSMTMLSRVYFPHSLGILYTAITQYLGFHGYGDEFKVMGLAPYGSTTHVDAIRKLVRLENGGRFSLDLRYFRHWQGDVTMEWEDGYPTLGIVHTDAIADLLGPAREPNTELTRKHEDIARSLQAVYEECAFHVLNDAWERTRSENLCLAGGCGMNSVANGKIRGNTPFKRLFIQPAAGDAGTALGAAYQVWHETLAQPRAFVMHHAYWGTEYPDAETQVDKPTADEAWRFTETTYPNEAALCEATARLIADGNVVGWYQGRMEWGARSLGNRSILADPRRADMRDLINVKIKFRERFRPFAPSILESAVREYFEDPAVDPFMQQVYPIVPDKRAMVPAITHVDGSGRLQTVSAETNARYHLLITEFAKLTGVPMLLNTSFNENEPIVDTPAQAMDCFRRTRMDAIVVGHRVIRRETAANADG